MNLPATPTSTAPPPSVAWRWLLALASVKLVIHALVGSGYGFHQDEFYYLSCGRRPDWGFVDQPPLVPLLGRLAETIFGAATMTPGDLRWFSALAGAGTVLFAGLMAREVGGGRYAQAVAALTVLMMPLLLSAGELFQTVVFDQLIWAAACWLVLRTLRTGRTRDWLWVGLVAGVGLETKHTMALFGAGLAVALLATRVGRQHLRTPWPWLGGGIALLMLLPNVLWQAAHGWPTAEFVHNNNAVVRADWSVVDFLLSQAKFAGPAAVPLLALGVWWACRPPRGPAKDAARAALCVAGTMFGALLVLRGKPYYAGSILPLLAALGGTAWEELTLRRTTTNARPWPRGLLRWAVPALLVLTVLPALPLVLPLTPRERLAGSLAGRLNDGFRAQIGWPELVTQIGAIYRALPADEQARAIIMTVDYEAASAIEHYDPALARQARLVSPHNTWWLWGPGATDPETVLVVGARNRPWMESIWSRVEKVATVDNPLHIANEQRGRGIWLCREPKRTLRAAWPELKGYQ